MNNLKIWNSVIPESPKTYALKYLNLTKSQTLNTHASPNRKPETSLYLEIGVAPKGWKGILEDNDVLGVTSKGF